jgi:hypothetical protein
LLAGGLPQQNFQNFWRANLQLLPTAEALEREREREREDALFCKPCFQEVRQNFLRYINLGQRPSECFQSMTRPFCLWFFLQ